MEKHNGDNIGSFHTLYLCKTKDLSNNDFDAQKFENIYFTEQTGKYGKAIKTSNNGSFWEHSISFEVPKYRQDVEAWLLLHIDVPLIAYIHTINGDMIRIGTKEMPLFVNVALDLGQKFSDFNSYTFKGKADELLKRNFGVTLMIPPPPPGDNGLTLLQNADLILSVRKVKTNYAGPAFLLRKVDGVVWYKTINFLPNGQLDLQAIRDFDAFSSIGIPMFVQTWYDQSGNNRHFVQINAENDPEINNEQPVLIIAGNTVTIDFTPLPSSYTGVSYLGCQQTTHPNQEHRTVFSKVTGNGSLLGFSGGSWQQILFVKVEKEDNLHILSDGQEQILSTSFVPYPPNSMFTHVYKGNFNSMDFYINKEKYQINLPADNSLDLEINTMILGGKGNIGTIQFNGIQFMGTMKEIIVMNGILPESEINKIQTNIINYFV